MLLAHCKTLAIFRSGSTSLKAAQRARPSTRSVDSTAHIVVAVGLQLGGCPVAQMWTIPGLLCLVAASEAPADRRRLAAYNYVEVDKLTASEPRGATLAIRGHDGDTVVIGAWRRLWPELGLGLRLPHDRRWRHVRPGSQAEGRRPGGGGFGACDRIPSWSVPGVTAPIGLGYVFRTDGGATYDRAAKLAASDAAAGDGAGISVASGTPS